MDSMLTPDEIVSREYRLKILQISDLHFGSPYVEEVGEAALRSAHRLQPDLLVVSGDLTQRARREQFAAARDYLERFPQVPRMVIPGNHDVPLYDVARRLRDPHRLYREIISRELNTVLQVNGTVLVGLDSTAPRSAISNGRIHSWQLDFCQQAFAQAPKDATKIVVAHHHFAPAPDYLHDSAMPKARRAINRFTELGVELIMGGHLHRAYIGNSLDFYPGEHRDRGIIIVQSGTTTSRRGRGREQEKNTFNLIELGNETIKITHYLYFDAEHGFIANSRHEFRRHASANPPSSALAG
ncbi:MAG: metallophosphoesterase [Planctomycetales bacterium]|nr:metallophosphoesterase [Planctomycetales bacterium]